MTEKSSTLSRITGILADFSEEELGFVLLELQKNYRPPVGWEQGVDEACQHAIKVGNLGTYKYLVEREIKEKGGIPDYLSEHLNVAQSHRRYDLVLYLCKEYPVYNQDVFFEGLPKESSEAMKFLTARAPAEDVEEKISKLRKSLEWLTQEVAKMKKSLEDNSDCPEEIKKEVQTTLQSVEGSGGDMERTLTEIAYLESLLSPKKDLKYYMRQARGWFNN